nr:MAG TPA: hypothetical protein [Caudoviricetes sp.]
MLMGKLSSKKNSGNSVMSFPKASIKIGNSLALKE